MPIAEVYARGLIAAFQGTGESVDEFAVERTDMRSKHYVLHAIKASFPDADLKSVCSALSVPGKAGFFYRNSVWFVLGQREGRDGPAHWWSEDLFGKVCAAVAEAHLSANPIPRPVPSVVPEKPPCATPAAPKAVLRHPEAPIAPERPAGRLRTRLDSIADGVSRAPRSPSNPNTDWLTEKAVDRGRSRDLLAEAAANTKKLQDAMPKDDGGE